MRWIEVTTSNGGHSISSFSNYQGSFISENERAPFNWLFLTTNDSIAKLTISISSGVSLWDKPCY